MTTTDKFIYVRFPRHPDGPYSSVCLMRLLHLILFAVVAFGACCLPSSCLNAAKAADKIHTATNDRHLPNECAVLVKNLECPIVACLSENCSMPPNEPAKYDRTRQFAVISETGLPQSWGFGPHATPVSSGPTLLMLGVLLRP